MGSPSKLFFAILCCLAFTVAHIHGELVLLQYPADINSGTQNYTCMSENDGTALIWSTFEKAMHIEDFKPKRPTSGNVRDCAIRGASTCLAKWDKTSDWQVVNSAAKPTGPVFDQRFEDFQEFGRVSTEEWQFQKVGVLNKSSGTVWFSVQEPKEGEVGIFLCQKEELHLGPCVRIITNGDQIHVQVWNIPPDYTSIPVGDLRSFDTSWFKDPHGDKWETFRLEWNTKQKTIKMFQGNDSEPFVQADMPTWDQVSALGTFTNRYHRRLRFHFYDYYFTDTKNAVISTKEIAHSGRIFCAELLVGLCPRCKLNVTLVDEGGAEVETWPFSGDGQDPYNGLLSWRLVKLNTRFDSDIPRRLTLKITTILDGDEGAGEWAVDNFQICESGTEMRESTITLASGISASCQKFSYAESSIVKNLMPKSHEAEVFSELQEFLRSRSGQLVGRGGLICNPRGCICDRGFTGSKCDDAPSTVEDPKTYWAWLAILPALSVCLLVLYIWYRYRGKELQQGPRVPNYLKLLEPLPTDCPTNVNAIVVSTPQAERMRDQQTTDYVYAVPNEPDSCSITLESFAKYVRNGASCGLFNSQFMKLTVGLTKPCKYGRLPENIQKNRYENLIAYDKTRVVLKRIHDNPNSDYINASYIRGYHKDRAYIATQGPMAKTVNDFWRMIWQEDVRVICMLTNVVEGSRTLCEQYWPESITRMKYGDILISKVDERKFADYTFRTFNLCTKEDTRKVTHLHYTGWPNPGLPMYPQSLVAYLKRLRDIPARNGPVVVHCHNGDDRTGTIILADICIRQGAAEGVIDAVAVIRRMRDDRANMVGTLQQYLLAHILIMESLARQPTQIPCTKKLSGRIKKMKMQLESDIRRLEDTMWQERALQSFATVYHPKAEDLVEQSRTTENSENPIGAVNVDGVRVKGQYIAAWLPPPLSLHKFWNFVVEKNTKLIIILQCSDPQNPSCCDIIPDEPTLLHMPHMKVQAEVNANGDEHFKTEKILLPKASEDNARLQTVTVLTCREWEAGENGKPPKTETLVSLWEASEKIPRQEGETLVLCHDGVTGCGLYLALSFMLERMAVERECDVFSAVRAVRRSRPQFVKTLEFDYLYNAAVTYAECFATYSNFT